MEFAPLYQLFTTKEDRLAIYKALKYGQKPKKVKELFEKVANETGPYTYDSTEAVKEISSNKTKDKSAELAKSAGVDLLTIKQLIFCDLMANSTTKIPADAEPFMCTTVKEIDALGKRVFGLKWENENAKGGKTYTVEYKDAVVKKALENEKLSEISAPLVYPEMFGVLPSLKGLGICTFLACLSVGAKLKDELKGFDLKGYLNNDPDRIVSEGIEKMIEMGFFFALYYYRSYKAIGRPFRTEDIEPKTQWLVIHENSCGTVLHPIMHGNDELWDAYRCVLLDTYDYSFEWSWRHHSAFCKGSREFRELLVDGILIPYLKNEWKHFVTSAPVMYTDDDKNISRLVVAADMDKYAESELDGTGREHPCERKLPAYVIEDTSAVLGDIENLSIAFDVQKNIGALIYTSVLYRFLWDWDFIEYHYNMTFRSKHREWKNPPKMLITNSCYVSVLRREGAELYFAFRAEDAEGESLELFVDNEADKRFVEECAESVGVTLNRGKNSLIFVEQGARNFEALDPSLDELSTNALVDEVTRYYLLSYMLSGSDIYYRGDMCDYAEDTEDSYYSPSSYYFDESCGHYLSNTTTITTRKYDKDELCEVLFTKDGSSCKRNIINLISLLGSEGYIDQEVLTDSFFAFDLENRSKVMFGGRNVVNNTTHAVIFPCAELIGIKYTHAGRYDTAEAYTYALNSPIPLLTKDGLCEYVRWEELPELIPEWSAEWSVVNGIPRRALREYLSAVNFFDLRGN